uniref:Uncharacterized protein n=1 Tax=Tanacetum cinerariifolium TaxID=118510 RepID=A0A6L2KIW0_TANCI|nr:hypothetical protein [Tanacetum cinerariifolium]
MKTFIADARSSSSDRSVEGIRIRTVVCCGLVGLFEWHSGLKGCVGPYELSKGWEQDVIENESHLILEIVDNNLGMLVMFTKHFIGGNGRRGGFIARICRGSLAKRLIESNDSLGGGSGKECLDGWIGAGGGKFKGGGVDFRVSKTLLGEIPGDIMGESGGEAFRVNGGVD